jgi:hypothetical protein
VVHVTPSAPTQAIVRRTDSSAYHGNGQETRNKYTGGNGSTQVRQWRRPKTNKQVPRAGCAFASSADGVASGCGTIKHGMFDRVV